MARYFFHVHDGSDQPDHDGTELSSLKAARAYAARYAGGLLEDIPDTFWGGAEWKMDVTDEKGLVLFSLHLNAIDSAAVVQAR